MHAYQELLDSAGCNNNDVSGVVGTGYGRISLPIIDKAVTEIHCHARGANYLVGQGGLLIDIGGKTAMPSS